MKKPVVSYPEIISHLQIEAEQTGYQFVRLTEKTKQQKKLILLNEFVDFNAAAFLHLVTPLLVTWEAINFVIRNSPELNRKLTFMELKDFSDKLKILRLFKKQPSSFAQFKEMCSKIEICKIYQQ